MFIFTKESVPAISSTANVHSVMSLWTLMALIWIPLCVVASNPNVS